MLKHLIHSLLLIAFPLLLVGSSPSIAAASSTSGAVSQVCQGIGTASGTGSGCDTTAPTSINSTITTIVNILSVIVGIAAVIMIVVAGFRFVVSGGDSAAVASAKNGLIYVIVGLVVVALAQIIVHFVLSSLPK